MKNNSRDYILYILLATFLYCGSKEKNIDKNNGNNPQIQYIYI